MAHKKSLFEETEGNSLALADAGPATPRNDETRRCRRVKRRRAAQTPRLTNASASAVPRTLGGRTRQPERAGPSAQIYGRGNDRSGRPDARGRRAVLAQPIAVHYPRPLCSSAELRLRAPGRCSPSRELLGRLAPALGSWGPSVASPARAWTCFLSSFLKLLFQVRLFLRSDLEDDSLSPRIAFLSLPLSRSVFPFLLVSFPLFLPSVFLFPELMLEREKRERER